MAKKTAAKTDELIYGIHPVVELLKAKRRKIIALYTTKPTPKAFKTIERLLPKYPVQIQYVSRDVLTKMVGTADHQSVVAWTKPFSFRKKPFDPKKHTFLLMLDGIQDQRNLGGMLRSAYCTNVDGVILTQKGSASLTSASLKSSAGLAEHLEILTYPSAHAAVQELHRAGYHLFLATVGSGVRIDQVTFDEPCCLIIGSEATGISKEILSAGTQVTIPERPSDSSYNASVAAGILLVSASMQMDRI